MPVVTRCALCGKKYEIGEDNPDYPKLIAKPSTTYICDMCKNKVRFESEDQQKPKKPM